MIQIQSTSLYLMNFDFKGSSSLWSTSLFSSIPTEQMQSLREKICSFSAYSGVSLSQTNQVCSTAGILIVTHSAPDRQNAPSSENLAQKLKYLSNTKG